jgi:thioredoxin 1
MEIRVDDNNFKQEVLESDVPVLVDFWAAWCMPCKMVTPVVEQIAEKYQGKLKVCKINVDEAPGTAREYGIMSIPTLTVFKDGKVIEKTVGAVPASKLESMIDPHME